MNKTEVSLATMKQSSITRVIARFSKNKIALVGFWLLVGFIAICFFAPLLAPYAPDYQSAQLITPPSWHNEGSVEHFFGTDGLGRDVLSRLIHGAQLTLGSAILVMIFTAFIGIPLGMLSGMSRGFKASALHHIMDATLSLPSLLIAIMLVSLLGPSLGNTLIAIVLAQIPQFIRFTHIAVAAEMQKEYIMAIKLDGANAWRILRFGVLPNIADALVSQSTRSVSAASFDIAALGFIGIGAQQPLPELGAMLGQTKDLLYVAPWTVLLPGLTLILFVLSVNLVSNGLRKAMSEGHS